MSNGNIKPLSYWKGKSLSKEHREKLSNALKGIKRNPFTEEHRNKIGDSKRGDKCPFWEGGITDTPYTVDWTNTLRRSIRERDHYTCMICGNEQTDKCFSVHHIDYKKENCDTNNLITLCNSCHTKTNYNRKYWEEKLKMVKSDKKATKYFKEGKVFPLSNTTNFEMWCVEGKTGLHNVRFDKIKKLYSCDCKNIRFTDCSHIKSVLLYKKTKSENYGKEI